MSDSPARRRWLTLSLRTLVVLIAVMALALGWYVQRVRTQRVAVAAIMKSGGRVAYGWEVVESPGPFGVPILEPLRNGKPPVPGWMTSLLSPDYFSDVRTKTVVRASLPVARRGSRVHELNQGIGLGSPDAMSNFNSLGQNRWHRGPGNHSVLSRDVGSPSHGRLVNGVAIP